MGQAHSLDGLSTEPTGQASSVSMGRPIHSKILARVIT